LRDPYKHVKPLTALPESCRWTVKRVYVLPMAGKLKSKRESTARNKAMDGPGRIHLWRAVPLDRLEN
jgi:hypothetical protein